MTPSPARRGPRCDALEPRRLFAVEVVGSDAADLIRIARDGTQLLAVTNGVERRYADVDQLVVTGGDGDDTIRIDDAGGVPVSVFGGTGDDRVFVGAGDLAAARLASVSVVGGVGLDTLTLDDSSSIVGRAGIVIDNPFDTYVVLTLPVSLGVVVSDASNAADAVESIVLLGGTGNDAVTLAGTNARAAITLNGGGGNDSVTFGNDVDSKLRGPLSVDGGAGDDTLVIDDSADAFADTYFFSGTADLGTLRKNSGGSTLSYSNVNALVLYAGAGGSFPNNQQFRVSYLPYQASTTIFAGTGDDVLYFGDGVRSLDDLHAGVVFAGQDGLDTIAYNDAIGTDAATYEVSSIFITNPGTGSIVYFDCEAIALRANDAANVLRVTTTVGATNVTLNGGGGDDRFEVGGGDIDATIANSVSVVGGAGNDSLAIDDAADDAGNDVYAFTPGLLLKTLKAVLWSSCGVDRTEAVSLAGSANADVVRISGGSPGVALNIDAGAGDDAIDVDRTSDATGDAAAAPATVTIASGSGRDTLDVNADGVGSDAIVALASPREELDVLRVRAGGRVNLVGGAAAIATVAGLLTIDGVLDIGASTLVARAADFATLVLDAASGSGGGRAAAIVSSTAIDTAVGDGVAVVRAKTVGTPTFGDVFTSASDVIVRYTLAGDSNVDRVVNFSDLLTLAQHFGEVGRTWAEGNSDYDASGSVGFEDLLSLAQNFGASVN